MPSIDNLLRMKSGLDIGDSLTARATTAFDPSAYMVFGVRDMAGFAEQAPDPPEPRAPNRARGLVQESSWCEQARST